MKNKLILVLALWIMSCTSDDKVTPTSYYNLKVEIESIGRDNKVWRYGHTLEDECTEKYLETGMSNGVTSIDFQTRCEGFNFSVGVKGNAIIKTYRLLKVEGDKVTVIKSLDNIMEVGQ